MDICCDTPEITSSYKVSFMNKNKLPKNWIFTEVGVCAAFYQPEEGNKITNISTPCISRIQYIYLVCQIVLTCTQDNGYAYTC